MSQEQCSYGVSLRSRLHEVYSPNIIKIDFDYSKCDILSDRYPQDDFSYGLELLKWIKSGKRFEIQKFEKPLALLSLEPRPENIDFLVRKFIGKEIRNSLIKYIRIKSHCLKENGKLNKNATYERMRETEEIIKKIIPQDLANVKILSGVNHYIHSMNVVIYFRNHYIHGALKLTIIFYLVQYFLLTYENSLHMYLLIL